MLEIENNSDLIFKIGSNSGVVLGDIVEFAVEDNQVVLVRSAGVAPVGFATDLFKDLCCSWEDDTPVFTRLSFLRMIARTDNYEVGEVYLIKSNLYVSSNGKLTSVREDPLFPAVAMVIESPGDNTNLRFMWF